LRCAMNKTDIEAWDWWLDVKNEYYEDDSEARCLPLSPVDMLIDEEEENSWMPKTNPYYKNRERWVDRERAQRARERGFNL
jgi:hypothetical protein